MKDLWDRDDPFGNYPGFGAPCPLANTCYRLGLVVYQYTDMGATYKVAECTTTEAAEAALRLLNG